MAFLHGMSVGVEWDCVCSFGAKLLGSRVAECGFNLRVSRGTGVDYLTSRFDPMMCGLGFVERPAREGMAEHGPIPSGEGRNQRRTTHQCVRRQLPCLDSLKTGTETTSTSRFVPPCTVALAKVRCPFRSTLWVVEPRPPTKTAPRSFESHPRDALFLVSDPIPHALGSHASACLRSAYPGCWYMYFLQKGCILLVRSPREPSTDLKAMGFADPLVDGPKSVNPMDMYARSLPQGLIS